MSLLTPILSTLDFPYGRFLPRVLFSPIIVSNGVKSCSVQYPEHMPDMVSVFRSVVVAVVVKSK